MTSRKKKRQQEGFIKKVSSLFNLDTVSLVVVFGFNPISVDFVFNGLKLAVDFLSSFCFY